MSDGSSGNLGGILFEAGKSLSDAASQQGQKIANSVIGQATGNTKPLFGGQKPTTSGSFTPKPAGSAKPALDPFGGLGNLFEAGKPPAAKQATPPVFQQQQFSQEDLDTMAMQNQAQDEQKIAAAQAELAQLTKRLHDENYYNEIRDVGKDSIQKERTEKAQQAEQDDIAQQQAAAQPEELLSGNPLAKNQQLGDPVSVQQAKTQTEVNRGTTG